MAPSVTLHLAGWPSSPSHWERSLPSNNTTASEGGRPGESCVLAVPGSITGGTGRSGSLGFQRESTCAMASGAMFRAKNSTKKIVLIGLYLDDTIHEISSADHFLLSRRNRNRFTFGCLQVLCWDCASSMAQAISSFFTKASSPFWVRIFYTEFLI